MAVESRSFITVMMETADMGEILAKIIETKRNSSKQCSDNEKGKSYLKY